MFEIEKDKKEIDMLSPLVWAYVGDAVYELYIRTNLVNLSNAKPGVLHKKSIKLVSAKAQAHLIEKLKEFLTEEEIGVLRRGRNTKTVNTAKNASVIEYAMSTGFEALIGYIYLTKNEKRLLEILEKIKEIFEESGNL